jgi:hypothetical protein
VIRWCPTCETNPITEDPDAIGSTCAECYYSDFNPRWVMSEGSWKLPPYYASEYLSTHYDSFYTRELRPDPVERAHYFYSKMMQWIDPFAAPIEFNTVDLKELREVRDRRKMSEAISAAFDKAAAKNFGWPYPSGHNQF